MAPALRIPVSLDLDSLRQQGKQASDHMGTVLRQIGKQFSDLNGEMLGIAQGTAGGVALAWSQSIAGTVVRFAAMGAAGYAAFKLIEGAISAAHDQLAAMVEIADKAQNVGLSPSAFQAFTAAAKGSKDELDDLESSLKTFFQNAKDVLDKSVSPDALDSEKRKWTDLETTIRSIRFEMSVGGGTDTFLTASGTQAEILSQRMLGVVQTVRQLYDSGQQLVALDLAEKAFGGNFADNIRKGKISVDDWADTIENRLVKGLQTSGQYSEDIVNQAKQLDDRLTEAWRTVDNNLNPGWEGLARAAGVVKSLWVEIVDLLAKASGLLPGAAQGGTPLSGPIAGDIQKQIDELETRAAGIRAAQAVPTGSEFGVPADNGSDDLRRIQDRIAALKQALELTQQLNGAGGPPLPPRRPVNIPETAASSGSDDVTAFDRTTDAINRHIATMNADAAAVGANKTQLEAMRAEMQLLQAIQRDDGEVTQDQIDKYAQLRATMGSQEALTAAGITLNQEHAESFSNISARITEASARLQSAKTAFEGVNDAMRFFGNETANALANINSQTKGIDLLRSALGDLTKELLRAALTGEGAFAKILGFASTTGGTGGIFGAIASIFGGARAGGGPVEAGKAYLVNENTPNSEIFVPGQTGMIYPTMPAPSIVPASIDGGAGARGGDIYVTINSSPTYQAGMTPTDMATIEAMQQRNNQQLRQQVQTDLRTNIRNDADYLSH